MIIHFSVLGVVIIASLLYNRNAVYLKSINKNCVLPLMPWLLVFGYLALLAAMRSGMNDTSLYISSFRNTVPGTNMAVWYYKNIEKDGGFYALGALFKQFISDKYHAWFLMFSVIESICFIRVFRRECNDVAVACFFFWSSTLYYNYFSMMRQWFAVALVFSGFQWMKEKKWLPYCILCVIAAQFHTSAYLGIAFYFLAQGKPWQKKQNFILGGSVVGLAFLSPLLSTLETTMQGTTYDYAIQTMTTNSGSSPVRAVLAAIPVVLSYVYRDKIEQENNRGLDLCVNLAVLNFLLNTIAIFTSGLFIIRLSTYIAIYNCILYSYLLEKAMDENMKQIVKPVFYVCYFLYFCYQMSHQGAWGYNSDILGIYY